jgi:hypothetical protein
MAVYLARNCPRCGNFWGVVVAKPNGSGFQPIHGLCSTCGYEISWAVFSTHPGIPRKRSRSERLNRGSLRIVKDIIPRGPSEICAAEIFLPFYSIATGIKHKRDRRYSARFGGVRIWPGE